jgi:hypothetical protein
VVHSLNRLCLLDSRSANQKLIESHDPVFIGFLKPFSTNCLLRSSIGLLVEYNSMMRIYRIYIFSLQCIQEHSKVFFFGMNDRKTKEVSPHPLGKSVPRYNLHPKQITPKVLSLQSIPSTYSKAISCSNSEKWKFAIQKELHSFKKNSTWETVLIPAATPILDTKWVFVVRNLPDGSSQNQLY